jgi:uncharacterized protein (TIGR02271 family)
VLHLDQLRALKGRTITGSDGSSLGTVQDLYADRSDGDPTFATVQTAQGLSFVPLAQAELRGESIAVPYDSSLVSSAPTVQGDEDLSPAEEDRLYAHYGLAGTPARTDAGTGAATGYDTSGPSTDDAMTRSEEHLQVGTQQVEAGRARLRKYVVSETESVSVPVTKERVTLEREPITEGNVAQAYDGPEISEEEHEVVLTEERPVVAKEAVPVERVRLGKEAVTEEVTVTEDVRKEQIEADGVYPQDATTTVDPSQQRL